MFLSAHPKLLTYYDNTDHWYEKSLIRMCYEERFNILFLFLFPDVKNNWYC